MLYKLDEKQILLDYIESERYEAAQEAIKKVAKETAFNILKEGLLSVEKTAECLSALSVEEVKKIQEEILQSSEQQQEAPTD